MIWLLIHIDIKRDPDIYIYKYIYIISDMITYPCWYQKGPWYIYIYIYIFCTTRAKASQQNGWFTTKGNMNSHLVNELLSTFISLMLTRSQYRIGTWTYIKVAFVVVRTQQQDCVSQWDIFQSTLLSQPPHDNCPSSYRYLSARL